VASTRACGLPNPEIITKAKEERRKFRPLHDRVVVKRIDAKTNRWRGIIIPDTAKEKPSQGEILSVGPGGRDEAGKLIRSTSRSATACCSQMVGQRGQDRRPGSLDHEGERHYGRSRRSAAAKKKGCVSAGQFSLSWGAGHSRDLEG